METRFKTYTGTKTIKAMPMNVYDAKIAGANVPASYFDVNCSSYDPGADGYLVDYPDGYRSWSPKKVFEEAYSLSETHVDRMKIELTELTKRICKATKAILTFGKIPEDKRLDLHKQVAAMTEYASILYNRIQYELEPHPVADTNPNPSAFNEPRKGDE